MEKRPKGRKRIGMLSELYHEKGWVWQHEKKN